MPPRSSTHPSAPTTLDQGLTGLDNARDGTCQFHFGTMVGPDGCPLCNPPAQAVPVSAPRPRTIDDTPPRPVGPTGARLPTTRLPTAPMILEPAEDLPGPIVIELGPRPIIGGSAFTAHGQAYIPGRSYNPTDPMEGDRA